MTTVTQFEANLQKSVSELKLLNKAGVEICKKIISDWFKTLSYQETEFFRALIYRWQDWGLSFDTIKILILVMYLTYTAENRDRVKKISLVEIGKPLTNYQFITTLLSLSLR